jgi:hypothetical protein
MTRERPDLARSAGISADPAAHAKELRVRQGRIMAGDPAAGGPSDPAIGYCCYWDSRGGPSTGSRLAKSGAECP